MYIDNAVQDKYTGLPPRVRTFERFGARPLVWQGPGESKQTCILIYNRRKNCRLGTQGLLLLMRLVD